jgi:hypothetical protein
MIDQAYRIVNAFYGDRCAQRSGVPLINHINEGVIVLDILRASDHAIAAYMLHPLFQNDSDLAGYQYMFHLLDPTVVAYIMEYRNIANASLSDIVGYDGSVIGDHWECKLKRPIKKSPIGPVNAMLIADKVQNYKDFITYHKDTHPRSVELDFYFKSWLETLLVPDQLFEQLCSLIDAEKSS